MSKLYRMLRRKHDPAADNADRMARREFLKMMSAGLGVFAVSQMPIIGKTTNDWGTTGTLSAKPNGSSVIVIGAGFAGLTAAYELAAKGFDVTVVEARNRVSGRVQSTSEFVDGKNVEFGGELIGSNHHSWIHYASLFGLEFIDVTEDEELDAPIVVDGRLLTSEESAALWEELETSLSAMNADAEKVQDATQPWLTDDVRSADSMSVADWIAKQPVSDLCKKAMGFMLTNDNAVDVDKQSYLGMLAAIKGGEGEKYWTDSEVYRCKGGNQQLATALAHHLGKRINLGLAATAVTVTQSGVTVKCRDGRTIDADEVVLAVPPTVWEKISMTVGKDYEIQMGKAVKYFSRFDSSFWLDNSLSPFSLGNGAVGWTWDGTDNQGDKPGYCLTSFTGGSKAVEVSAMNEDARKTAYATELEQRYPGYKEGVKEARPMLWTKDPWTMAGYCFPAPGQVTTVARKLYEGQGRLHFAGEHTSMAFMGYMNGGLESGRRVAKQIVDKYAARKADEPVKQPA